MMPGRSLTVAARYLASCRAATVRERSAYDVYFSF
jgi:hypothetical protein